MGTSKVIAVTEQVTEAGAIVYWSLSGTVDYDRLAAAWKAAGLPEGYLPQAPSPDRAMRRAVLELGGPRRLVRPLSGHHGWAVVDEHASDADVEYQTQLTVKLDAVGRPMFDPKDHPLAQELGRQYVAFQTALTTTDVSGWLVFLLREVAAVGLRHGGGMYFVPRAGLDRWRTFVEVLRSASSHACFSIPAMHSDDAVAAILDALQREAEEEITAIEEKLDGEELGARALRGRVNACSAMERKLTSYEGLLGKGLEEVQAKIAVLQARLVEAALKAEAEASEAA